MGEGEGGDRAQGVKLLPYQAEAVGRSARFTWNCWARQTGKSFTFSLRRLVRGLLRGRDQIILSAGERQSREVMQKVRQHCEAMQLWFEEFEEEFLGNSHIRQLEIRLSSGVRIIGLPANPMTARGFTGDVFLDEFAMHRDNEAIWAALLPTIVRGEGELDVASTPRGRRNMFHQLRSNAEFSHCTLTLEDAIGQGLNADARSLREAIGDELAWRQEFCCEFSDEATNFMSYELIRSCQDAAISTRVDWTMLGERRREIYAGMDVGRRRDLSVVWLWERCGEVMATCGVIVMRQTPFNEQEALLDRLMRQPAIQGCCIDATGLGLQLAECLVGRFGAHCVEAVMLTGPVKSRMAGMVRVMAEQGKLRIPADEAVLRDWHSVERLVSSSGNLRYESDRSGDGHGDRFWAAALGLRAAGDPRGDAGFESSGPLRFSREGVW